MSGSVPLKRLAELRVERRRSDADGLLTLEVVESGTGRLLADPWDSPVEPPHAGVADVETGDVLFGKLRPYLAKVVHVTRPAYASTELLCLRPNTATDPRWFFYRMIARPTVEWAAATSEGTKMPRTSWERLGEFHVHVPALSKQRAIADYLDTETARIDALIAKKVRLRVVLANRLAALLEQEIRGLVAAWGQAPLKFLVDGVTVGIVITPSAWYVNHESGVVALRGVNVEPGRLRLENLVRISSEGHAVHSKSALRASDVVVVRTGQAGVAAVVPAELDGANCIDLILVRPGQLDPEFLQFVLNSDWARKHIAQHSVGTIQSHFNIGAMKELPVPRAPKSVQWDVAGRMRRDASSTERMTLKLSRQIDLLREHRHALITAAVTGELEIPGAA